MDKAFLFLILACLYFVGYSESVATPSYEENLEHNHEKEENPNHEEFDLEYGRYLQQVVQALEQDSDFVKSLEMVSAEEIKNGNIAKELDFVKHTIRSELDEIKRIELQRLRELARMRSEQSQMGLFRNEDGWVAEPLNEHRRWRTIRRPPGDLQEQQLPTHLNIQNRRTFEIDDLKRLIQSANKDLDELDKKRRHEFKNYEMDKELQYRNSLSNMTEEETREAEQRHEDLKKKHQDHPSINHPGSKQQLQQVWEEQDKLPKEEFDPKVFFAMHDVNQDGYLDEQEVEAILAIEVKKMYDPARNPEEDDPVEMMEEYNRMREHIFSETDKDNDRLISKQEFLDFTKREHFAKDEGWEDIEDQTHFSEIELEEFEKLKIKDDRRQRHGLEGSQPDSVVDQKEDMLDSPTPYILDEETVKRLSNPKENIFDIQEMVTNNTDGF